mmetsp:Transcript_36788/g.101168  ORF Transcript_36788/g.101168 Transcript_36788/m.101168 type:complete len:382 (+) Transcript_36788:148-1293(+)
MTGSQTCGKGRHGGNCAPSPQDEGEAAVYAPNRSLDDMEAQQAVLDRAFVSQVSSSSEATTATGDTLNSLFSRQTSEIDVAAAQLLEELPDAVEEAVCAVAAACSFSMTVGDPRRPDIPLIAVSKAFETMTGYDKNEILGHSCRFINAGCNLDPEDVQKLREACRTGRPFTGVVPNRRKTGELFHNLLDLRGLTVAENPQTGAELWFVVGVQADVTGLSEDEMPTEHLNELRAVADGLHKYLVHNLSTMAICGAFLAEASGLPESNSEAAASQGMGPPLGLGNWRRLPEPRWRVGAQIPPLELSLSSSDKDCEQEELEGGAQQHPQQFQDCCEPAQLRLGPETAGPRSGAAVAIAGIAVAAASLLLVQLMRTRRILGTDKP